ncbi:MAG: hypothetical protein ACJAQ9_002751, partial [Ilumatobacter sp.]
SVVGDDRQGSLTDAARWVWSISPTWGKSPSARKQLESLSTHAVSQRVNDCYLIVDDTSWSAKVRETP